MFAGYIVRFEYNVFCIFLDHFLNQSDQAKWWELMEGFETR